MNEKNKDSLKFLVEQKIYKKPINLSLILWLAGLVFL